MAIERWGENSNCDWTGVTEDAYIDDSDPNLNYGFCLGLAVYSGFTKSLIKFDLSELSLKISS